MSQQLSNTTIKDSLIQINYMESIINKYNSYINMIQIDINNIKLVMKNNCNHIYTIDRTAMNEHTEYCCSICLQSL